MFDGSGRFCSPEIWAVSDSASTASRRLPVKQTVHLLAHALERWKHLLFQLCDAVDCFITVIRHWNWESTPKPRSRRQLILFSILEARHPGDCISDPLTQQRAWVVLNDVLEWSSITVGDRQMVQEDWIDFVYRLTTKFNSWYVTGALSDPSDLLEYFLSIVPGIAQMCIMDSTWTSTPPCGCRTTRKERLTEECRLTKIVSSNELLVHHIHKIVQPEEVSDYRCDCCGRQSCSECPAIRQWSLRSLPRFLRINITAPLTSAGLPPDYHHHGSLRNYQGLDLSQINPRSHRRTSRYTLCAAIMYSKKHYWAYLNGTTPVVVSDHICREATPTDIRMTARCAQLLI